MEPSSKHCVWCHGAARQDRPGQSCNERLSASIATAIPGILLLLHQLTNMLTDGRFNAASLAIGLTVAASTGPALPKIQLIAAVAF